MPLIKRSELQDYLSNPKSPEHRVFLFFGERYLCKESADLLQEQLLTKSKGSVNGIDGDREDPAQLLSRLMSFSLLPGRQIFRVTDTRLFHSKTIAEELWAKAVQANAAGKNNPATRYLQSMILAAGLGVESRNPLGDLDEQQWQKSFSFAKPTEALGWADDLLFASRDSMAKSGEDIADRFIAALDKGLPAQNTLLLTAETVDKRQRLFTYLKKNELVIDCSVTAGAGSAAQTEQKDIIRELMIKTLAQFGKKIDPQAVELFFERVGFHPVAVVMESEKLAHYVGDNPVVTSEDLDVMLVNNRENALFELTDAFAKRQLGRTLLISSRLREHGMHELAIIATMRNFIRSQLIYKSLQLRPHPVWRRGMSAKEFQSNYLPALKADSKWQDLLQGHPYALFMSFTKAAEYSIPGLKRWMSLLLEAEYRLKGSSLPQGLILEELFLSMLKGTPPIPN